MARQNDQIKRLVDKQIESKTIKAGMPDNLSSRRYQIGNEQVVGNNSWLSEWYDTDGSFEDMGPNNWNTVQIPVKRNIIQMQPGGSKILYDGIDIKSRYKYSIEIHSNQERSVPIDVQCQNSIIKVYKNENYIVSQNYTGRVKSRINLSKGWTLISVYIIPRRVIGSSLDTADLIDLTIDIKNIGITRLPTFFNLSPPEWDSPVALTTNSVQTQFQEPFVKLWWKQDNDSNTDAYGVYRGNYEIKNTITSASTGVSVIGNNTLWLTVNTDNRNQYTLNEYLWCTSGDTLGVAGSSGAKDRVSIGKIYYIGKSTSAIAAMGGVSKLRLGVLWIGETSGFMTSRNSNIEIKNEFANRILLSRQFQHLIDIKKDNTLIPGSGYNFYTDFDVLRGKKYEYVLDTLKHTGIRSIKSSAAIITAGDYIAPPNVINLTGAINLLAGIAKLNWSIPNNNNYKDLQSFNIYNSTGAGVSPQPTGRYFVGNINKKFNINDKNAKGIKYLYTYEVNIPQTSAVWNWRVTTVDYAGNESSGTTAVWSYYKPDAATSFVIWADGVRMTFSWVNPTQEGIKYAKCTSGNNFVELFNINVSPDKKSLNTILDQNYSTTFAKYPIRLQIYDYAGNVSQGVSATPIPHAVYAIVDETDETTLFTTAGIWRDTGNYWDLTQSPIFSVSGNYQLHSGLKKDNTLNLDSSSNSLEYFSSNQMFMKLNNLGLIVTGTLAGTERKIGILDENSGESIYLQTALSDAPTKYSPYLNIVRNATHADAPAAIEIDNAGTKPDINANHWQITQRGEIQSSGGVRFADPQYKYTSGIIVTGVVDIAASPTKGQLYFQDNYGGSTLKNIISGLGGGGSAATPHPVMSSGTANDEWYIDYDATQVITYPVNLQFARTSGTIRYETQHGPNSTDGIYLENLLILANKNPSVVPASGWMYNIGDITRPFNRLFVGNGITISAAGINWNNNNQILEFTNDKIRHLGAVSSASYYWTGNAEYTMDFRNNSSDVDLIITNSSLDTNEVKIKPPAAGRNSLGDSNNWYRDIYTNILRLNNTPTQYMDLTCYSNRAEIKKNGAAITDLVFNGWDVLRPNVDLESDIGVSAAGSVYRWKNVYFGGGVQGCADGTKDHQADFTNAWIVGVPFYNGGLNGGASTLPQKGGVNDAGLFVYSSGAGATAAQYFGFIAANRYYWVRVDKNHS